MATFLIIHNCFEFFMSEIVSIKYFLIGIRIAI